LDELGVLIHHISASVKSYGNDWMELPYFFNWIGSSHHRQFTVQMTGPWSTNFYFS